MTNNNTHQLRISSISQGERGKCKNVVVSWDKLKRILGKPKRDETMTLVKYQGLGVDAKNKAKDVGSFVAGHFPNNLRKRENLSFRSCVSLDIDTMGTDQIEDLEMGISKVSKYEFFGHTTRSHTLVKPKWRLIFPTVKNIPPDHYHAVSRILSSMVFSSIEESMDAVDDVSHRPAQIMYLPSVCKDGQFLTMDNPGQLLDHEALLATWENWQDYSTLPYSTARGMKRPGQLTPAERPNEKDNFVGVFCRVYSVPEAIEEFIPEVYVKPVKAGKTIRYTYAKGSGAQGAIVQDDGLFLYSHHGTDPCGERLVNAFDMVRAHLYGGLDAEKDDGTPATKLPSFKAMMEKAKEDPRVTREMRRSYDAKIDRQFEVLEEDGIAAPRSLDDDEDEDDLIGAIGASPRPSDLARGQANVEAALAAGEEDDEDDILGGGYKVKHANGHSVEGMKGKVPEFVRRINEQHAIVRLGNKVRVAILNPEKSIDFMDKQNFFDLDRSQKIPKPNSTSDWTLNEAWFEHEMADRYPRGVVFKPDDVKRPGYYNLWRGWNVEPNPKGSCKLFLNHLREQVCNGNLIQYDWLLKWIAHMFQKPAEKIGSAVIMKGEEGIGKDFIGRYLSVILDNHYFNTSHQEQVFGKHNKHMQACLLMHMEEGFWAGSREIDSKLKNLVSGTRQPIEPKGVDTYMVDSYLRVMITSNEDLVIPAGKRARRYYVTTVSDRYTRETAEGRVYHDALHAEMANGGPAALLDFLLKVDLGDTDLRFAPSTSALVEQKRASLRAFDRFWVECLESGHLPGIEAFTSLDDEEKTPGWEDGLQTVWCHELFDAYSKWQQSTRRFESVMDSNMVGKHIRDLCPSIDRKRRRERGPNNMRYVYLVPSLEQCREECDAALNANGHLFAHLTHHESTI